VKLEKGWDDTKSLSPLPDHRTELAIHPLDDEIVFRFPVYMEGIRRGVITSTPTPTP
jgi:hypothetical protein